MAHFIEILNAEIIFYEVTVLPRQTATTFGEYSSVPYFKAPIPHMLT